MSKKWLKVALMVTAIATGTSIQVDAETVLYVPQDDRPVSLQYTVDTAKAAGMTVLTPPQNLISGKTYKENTSDMRIIADHLRGAYLLAARGLPQVIVNKVTPCVA